MISREEYESFREHGIPQDRILTDDVDPVKLWKQYVDEDDNAICGQGTRDLFEIDYFNTTLAKQSGIETYLPCWGNIIDIGAGYNPIKNLLSYSVSYYPCDLIKRTPFTIEINGSLPFADEFSHFVVSCNVFQHLTEKQRLNYIEESHRVLVENGRLFIGCHCDFGFVKIPNLPYQDGKYYCITGNYMNAIPNREEVIRWNEIVGFRVLNVTTRMDGFHGFWFEKEKRKEKSDGY